MRFPTLFSAANAALLLDHSTHTPITWDDLSWNKQVSVGNPIRLFGDRKFSSFYINGFGSVTTDEPQLRIANSQTYSDRGINDNIIFAPNWAAVQGTPTVHYANTLSPSQAAIVENEIKTNRPQKTIRDGEFDLDSVLVATWSGMKLDENDADSSYQIVIASDGYFSYVLYSFDDPNGDKPDWSRDADHFKPVHGILTHHRRMDLCVKSEASENRDWKVGSVYGWNTYDELDCSDCRSFTECGGMKEQDLSEAADANTQYTYMQYYKSLPDSVLSHYSGQYYAVCQCNAGFSIDAAMNDIFERKCIYDADMYESSWESTEDANGNSRFTCQDYETTKIQLDYGQPISIDLNVWPSKFEFLLYIDAKLLPAKFQQMFFMLIKAIFEEVMKQKISASVSVNLHPENYRNRRRQSRQAVLLGNDDQGIELTDFDNMMDWVGDWAPEFGLIDDIDDFLTIIEDTAEEVGAIRDEQVTTELDVILGIEDDPDTVTPEEINEVVEEALLVMTNNTAVTDPVKQNIQSNVDDELARIVENTACHGLRPGTGNNPFWQKPDSCCGPPGGDPNKAKPYLSSVYGCCGLNNGWYRTYELSTQACCDGVILNQSHCEIDENTEALFGGCTIANDPNCRKRKRRTALKRRFIHHPTCLPLNRSGL